MTLLINQITSILKEAAESKIGILVRFDFTGEKTQSLYQVSRLIYRVKKELGEELNLPALQIRASPDNPDNEMWIFKLTDEAEINKSSPPSSSRTLSIGDID